VLHAAGFRQPLRRPFDPALEAENHEIGSLCMRAYKSAPAPSKASALSPCPSSNSSAPDPLREQACIRQPQAFTNGRTAFGDDPQVLRRVPRS
jgi:hypothetical protein